MQAEYDLVVSVAAAKEDSVDAGEDGDFAALRERREARTPEEVDLSFINDLLSKTPEPNVDNETPSESRILRSTFRKQSTVAGNAWRRWTSLTEAALRGPVHFKAALTNAASQTNLNSKLFHNPLNRQNILNFVLKLEKSKIIDVLVEIIDAELVEHSFDVNVMKINGKKTALHQVVEKNNLSRLKILLEKIDNRARRISLLNEETPIDFKGQAPRTLPCLHLAAYYGFRTIVEFIIKEGVDVNHLNAKRDTALLWAARWGHIETVRSLLLHGARPDLENDKGSTALYWAVRYGHEDVAEVLVAEGNADVNKQRKLGLVAPIVLASALGLSKTVAVLLKYGANPNTAIRGNERAIHHAAKEGFSEIVELLVDDGAEVDAADVRGDNALLLAARYGSAKAFQTLLKHRPNLDHKNLQGENVWKIAVSHNNDVVLKLLVGHQRWMENEDTEDDADQTDTIPPTDGPSVLLFMAAAAGNLEKMSLLFQLQVDPSVTDEKGNTVLHTAAMSNQPQVIDKFHKKVDIDVVNSKGNTALHEACSRGHSEVIVTLIKLKAMANIRNAKGETALHVAARCGSIQSGTVSLLMDYVIKTHSWECLHMKDNNNNNALHIAAKHAQPNVLWEFRFVHLNDVDNEGNTALHNAIRSRSPDVLDKMIDIYDVMKRDCDINHRNMKTETPLFLAAKEGLLDGVKRLMSFGADISIPGPEGNTVLHLLTSLTLTKPEKCTLYLEIIDAVLEKAAVWYSTKEHWKRSEREQNHLFIRRRAVLELVSKNTNSSGLTVLDLACKIGASEVVKLLVSMENVMTFRTAHGTRYDITNLIPRTIDSVGKAKPNRKTRPRPSCLNWLLFSGKRLPHNAAKVLDIQPFHEIESYYGAIAHWSYAVMIVVHVLYMSVFSWSGLELLRDARLRPGNETFTPQRIVTYTIVPLEAFVILGYNVARLISFGCSGLLSIRHKALKRNLYMIFSIPTVVSILYSMSVFVWVVMYTIDYAFKDIFLAIALCSGWMLSTTLTRGFKAINYFWRLIKILIVRDAFKFLFLYCFVLLAFSFAFHALFEVSQEVVDQFPNPLYTIYLMFNMMIGMEYIFDQDHDVLTAGLAVHGRSVVVLKVLYVLYMIFATIVLLNILIAMMNDSYQEILAGQQVTWRIESVALGVDLERSSAISFNLLSKIKIVRGHICPSDQKRNVLSWYIDVENTEDDHLAWSLSQDVEDEQLFTTSL